MGQEIGDYIEKLNIDFSAENLKELFLFLGVSKMEINVESVKFSQFVFSSSSIDEIYGSIERKLIKDLDNIFIFPEKKKIVAKNTVSSRLIAADLRGLGEDIYNAVLFMKVVIKAYEGWPMFILRLSDGIHIGMRVYDKDQVKNCTLSEVTQIEEILENYVWVIENDDLLKVHSIMYELISPSDSSAQDYDEMALRRRGPQRSYIESLEYLGRWLQIDTSYAIRRYKEWFEKENEYSFYKELQDELDYLQDIKSSKVNTLEMLFEAEELERKTYDVEQKYMQTIESESNVDRNDNEIIDFSGKDPEEMIKLLKEKKGIL